MASYKFIVGIDFGANSTSFSFAHIDDKYNIKNVIEWPGIDEFDVDFDGRVASSVLYRQEEDLPSWGGHAHKKFYNEQKDLFHAPQIRLYLTDYENQPPIPGKKLTPIKLVSDYLKQVHSYGLLEMKKHYHRLDEYHKYGEPLELEMDQIRYVFSYPDNQKNTDYQAKIKVALEMAGIITDNDPEDKLQFLTESGAAAFFCATLTSGMKVSPDLYLVCSVRDTLGLSTIEVSELPETAKVSLLDDQASIPCGNVKVDENMRKYLKDNVTASPEDDTKLEQFRDRLFDFYIKRIKPSFGENREDFYVNLEDAINIHGTTIKSTLLSYGKFVFPYKDMKKYIFDPVTNNILYWIELATQKFETTITGISLLGSIGNKYYLKKLVQERFGSSCPTVISMGDSPFAVSNGLIVYGTPNHNASIPCFIYKEIKQKNIIRIPGNEGLLFSDNNFNEAKMISHNDVDYVIGIDFGDFESSIAFAPVISDYRRRVNDLSIKDAIPALGSCSTPSILYYSSRMKNENKFGDYTQKKSTKRITDGILLRYFKPLIARDFDPNVDDKLLREIDDFELVDAVSNYLKDLNKEGIRQIKRQVGTTIDKDKLIYVIPVPHHWSKEAKNTMMTAIKKAELVNSKYFDKRIVIITDAEAITCHCQRYFADKFAMEEGQRFMICNIQERNISLTTFQVETDFGVEPILYEITSNSCDDSAFDWIDQKFKKFIINQLENSAINYTESGLKSIENYFASHIKPNFISTATSDLKEDIKIPVPLEFSILSDFDNPTGLIVDDSIVIPYDIAKSELFKPAVDSVLKKITKQLEKLPENERQIDAILVVGTFDLSLFLYKHIRERFEGKLVGAKFVGKPGYHDLAISRGAASSGLEPRLISEGVSQYSYFLQVRDIYRDQLDDHKQKIVVYDGQEYSTNIFSEIIAEGTKITKGVVCIQRVFVAYPNDLILAIYSSDEDEELRLTPVLKLQVKISKIPKFEEGDRVELEICFEIKGSYMDIDILYEGELLKHDALKIGIITKQKYKASLSTPLWERSEQLYTLTKRRKHLPIIRRVQTGMASIV